MKIPGSILTMLAGIALTLVSFWYGQNHNLLPAQASEEASLVDGLFNTMMVIGTGIFLLVQGVLIISAWRFRRREGDNTDGPPVHGNIPLEILWTAIPAVIVLGLSVYSFEVYQREGGIDPMAHSVAHAPAMHQDHQPMVNLSGAAIAAPLPTAIAQAENPNEQLQNQVLQDPATATVRKELPQNQDAPAKGVVSPRLGATPENQGKPPAYEINVTGMQYAWIFTYPDTGIVSSELHVPIGKEVKLNISANDVIHAFWVPEFRLKQDAVPGRQGELRFTASKAGEYPVICAELCGAYHGAMKTTVLVEAPEAFDSWLRSQQVASTSLEQAVAFSSVEKSSAEFLAPYTKDLNVNPEALQQLHSDVVHSHHFSS